jgi:hypothetical protein
MKVRIRLRPWVVEGTNCPFPVVRLRVRDKYGTLAELDFQVDTQADFTTIPIEKARSEGIPFSEAEERTAIGMVGETTMYCDRVRLVIAGREHDWPCHFIKVPVLQEPGQPTRQPLPVLGRAGFLDEYALTVDSGSLIVTRLGPFRRWFRQGLQRFWKLLGLVHPADRPL